MTEITAGTICIYADYVDNYLWMFETSWVDFSPAIPQILPVVGTVCYKPAYSSLYTWCVASVEEQLKTFPLAHSVVATPVDLLEFNLLETV